MAGIYIHIPFCRKACNYCNFHFTTNLSMVDEMVEGIKKEIKMRLDFFSDKNIETIYFGGGTPSILNQRHYSEIFSLLEKHYIIEKNAEITMEANPEDVDNNFIGKLKGLPFNRFSLGAQSFHEDDLIWMNRNHNHSQAIESIKRLQDAQYINLNLDLIYGYPLLTQKKWASNLDRFFSLEIPHLSSYAMTVEPKTALGHLVAKGKASEMDDNQTAEQFNYLLNQISENGYEQYEISNFSKPENNAIHNTNYWLKKPYLGIGPGAHSYINGQRRWNLENNSKYLKGVNLGDKYWGEEILTPCDVANESIMTSIRTKWGCNLDSLYSLTKNLDTKNFKKSIDKLANKGHLKIVDNTLFLTQEGKLFADAIAAELFFEDQL